MNFGDAFMKLTRIVALAGMMALAAPAAYAQGGGGGGQGRGMQALLNGITLTDKQKASVDSITQAFRAQMPPMQQGTQPDSATRAKMGEVRQKQYAAVRGVLTADQQKVFDKNLEEMRNRPRPQ
jgi:Spy/CpxP family protein refolding chaperone